MTSQVLQNVLHSLLSWLEFQECSLYTYLRGYMYVCRNVMYMQMSLHAYI
uniref:Uncharacterized protein n=1 Tax=Anguilla anguilla TaxID=7936 RepID=A0A0E9VYL2_ANGAN